MHAGDKFTGTLMRQIHRDTHACLSLAHIRKVSRWRNESMKCMAPTPFPPACLHASIDAPPHPDIYSLPTRRMSFTNVDCTCTSERSVYSDCTSVLACIYSSATATRHSTAAVARERRSSVGHATRLYRAPACLKFAIHTLQYCSPAHSLMHLMPPRKSDADVVCTRRPIPECSSVHMMMMTFVPELCHSYF